MDNLKFHDNSEISYFPGQESKLDIGQTVSPALLQNFIETLSYGVLIIDLDGRVLLRNQQSFESLPSGPDCSRMDEHPSIFQFLTGEQLIDFTKLFHRSLKRKQGVVYESMIAGQVYRIQNLQCQEKGLFVLSLIEVEEEAESRNTKTGKLLDLSHYDQLTGLPNRNFFSRKLKRLIEQSSPFAVLFIDLDNFKRINDTYGYETGDILLQQVAGRLAQCCRERDTVFRLGDDEFCVLFRLENNKEITAEIFSQRVIEKLQECFYIKGKDYYTSASIGLALFPEDGDDVQTLSQHADLAMDEAKRTGKNKLKLFCNEMHEKTVRRNNIEEKLYNAIDDNELTLFYQPITSIKTGKVIGMEALLRWFPEGEKAISPGEFIPIAEESSLILKLDDWVLKQSIKMLKDLETKGYGDLYVSINICSKHFTEFGLSQDVEQLLIQYGVDASRLVVEITEHRLMQNIETANLVMKRLVDLGVRISIDDFGTGHSSLSYLREFPVSSLKIDKCFIDSLWYGEGDLTILNSIIGLAKNLGLEMTAEGVETETQLMFLKTRQCDNMQGYYFSPPLPEERFYQLLESKRTL